MRLPLRTSLAVRRFGKRALFACCCLVFMTGAASPSGTLEVRGNHTSAVAAASSTTYATSIVDPAYVQKVSESAPHTGFAQGEAVTPSKSGAGDAQSYFGGSVGIGTPAPASDVKEDVAGAVKVEGTGPKTCATTADVGKMRYNSATGFFEICAP